MSTIQIHSEVSLKLDRVRAGLAAEISGHHDVCLTCSFQAEDVALVHLIVAERPEIPVLFLETGYHFAETLAYRDQIAERFGLNLVNLMPKKSVAEQEAEHGQLFRIAPDRCCALRKVEPLFEGVGQYEVWFTGLRREQSVTREELPLKERDAENQLHKFNPLAEWSTDEVWDYLREYDVPTNALHALGYPSIGCLPCTRPIAPGEDLRAGRWWWEDASYRECGLHPRGADHG